MGEEVWGRRGGGGGVGVPGVPSASPPSVSCHLSEEPRVA